MYRHFCSGEIGEDTLPIPPGGPSQSVPSVFRKLGIKDLVPFNASELGTEESFAKRHQMNGTYPGLSRPDEVVILLFQNKPGRDKCSDGVTGTDEFFG
jgi:hypothetical protein